jgi:hypothetical protein
MKFKLAREIVVGGESLQFIANLVMRGRDMRLRIVVSNAVMRFITVSS